MFANKREIFGPSFGSLVGPNPSNLQATDLFNCCLNLRLLVQTCLAPVNDRDTGHIQPMGAETEGEQTNGSPDAGAVLVSVVWSNPIKVWQLKWKY